MDKKHIQNITETDDSVSITFEKEIGYGSNDKGISKESGSETTVSSIPKEKKESVKEEKNNKIKELNT